MPSGARVTNPPPLFRGDLEDDRPHKIISEEKYIKLLKTDCNFGAAALEGCARQVGSESVLSATFGSSPLFLLMWFYFIVEIKLAAKGNKAKKYRIAEFEVSCY